MNKLIQFLIILMVINSSVLALAKTKLIKDGLLTVCHDRLDVGNSAFQIELKNPDSDGLAFFQIDFLLCQKSESAVSAVEFKKIAMDSSYQINPDRVDGQKLFHKMDHMEVIFSDLNGNIIARAPVAEFNSIKADLLPAVYDVSIYGRHTILNSNQEVLDQYYTGSGTVRFF